MEHITIPPPLVKNTVLGTKCKNTKKTYPDYLTGLKIKGSPQENSPKCSHDHAQDTLPSDESTKLNSRSPIVDFYFVLFFIAWLYLAWGISQEKCNTTIKYICYIIKQSPTLSSNVKIEDKIPSNVQTITKNLHLNPIYELNVCCQKCYSVYALEVARFECGYWPNPESPIYGKDLFDSH